MFRRAMFHRHRDIDGQIQWWVIWIVLFTVLAGPYWPKPIAILFMGLSLFGLLHLSVLVYERITAPRYHENMTPHEFEQFCAALLNTQKWNARVTKATCDQGVDIVADKRNTRIVLQCKKYSKPVGNQAVQQIVAAVAFENAQRAVVVSTSGFTRSAEALAASNNVILVHYSELRFIDRLLRL